MTQSGREEVSRRLAVDFYKGQEQLRLQGQLGKLIANDPILKFKPSELGLGRVDLFNTFLEKSRRFYQVLGRKPVEGDMSVVLNCFPEQMPLGIHWKLFVPTLQNLCNEKQMEKFLRPAQRMEMLGCYAQTQLGHGSDVQSLQTTATFDLQRQEFIIDSPTVSSTKWWIGQAGFISNWAVVFAQLIIKDKNYGLHAFLVQIRNSDHQPVPGVKVGQLGPKYGFVNKDNGFIRFDKIRVPRQHMLMKYAKVSDKGQYSRRGDLRISYATMLVTRVFLADRSVYSLAKVAAIATRFSHIRTQFKEKDKDLPVIQYQLQRQKVYPSLADVFAYLYGSQELERLCNLNVQLINERNDFRMLNDCHALSSGIKAVYSWGVYFSIEKLRRACGGHGFSMYSGIPSIFYEFAATPTFQGDNTVLMLQLGRYLLKSFDRAMKGKPVSDSVTYLVKIPRPSITGKQNLNDSGVVLQILAEQAHHRISRTGYKLAELAASGVKQIDAWNRHVGVRVVQAARAHINYWTYRTFKARVDRQTHAGVKNVLSILLGLYGSNVLTEGAGERLGRPQFHGWVQEVREALLEQLAPHDMTIVQAFRFGQNQLFSAWTDNKAYQRLIQWAKQENPVNREDFQKQFRGAAKEVRGKMAFESKL